MKQALCISNFSDLINLLDNKAEHIETKLISREICEVPENNYLQIIPYIVFYSLNYKTNKLEFLTYKRAKKINEEKLVDKISNGFGGHIDTIEDIIATEHITNEDSTNSFKMSKENLLDTCLKAGARELAEELYVSVNVNEINKDNIIFFFGDQTEEVNKVHLGALILIKIPSAELHKLKSKEEFNKEEIDSLDILSIDFKNVVETYNIEYVSNNITNILKENNYESWTQLTIEYILRREYLAVVSKTTYNDYINNYLKDTVSS